MTRTRQLDLRGERTARPWYRTEHFRESNVKQAPFQLILLPVDGSLTMPALLRRTLALAAALGASVLAVHVVLAPAGAADGDAAASGAPDQAAAATDAAWARAGRIVQQVERDARELAVPCASRVVAGGQPWQAILQLAAESGAGLICMAAHGRLGENAAPLGSQTAQVLAHATVPALVFR